jgi:hypothetical protein
MPRRGVVPSIQRAIYGLLLLTVLNSHLLSVASFVSERPRGEHERDGGRHEAVKILAELPDRIIDVIKPFAHHSPDHPALVQGDVTSAMRSWRPPSLTRRSSEEVVAFVELLPGSAATPSDLMAHAMRLLAPYKRPSEIIVLDVLCTGCAVYWMCCRPPRPGKSSSTNWPTRCDRAIGRI